MWTVLYLAMGACSWLAYKWDGELAWRQGAPHMAGLARCKGSLQGLAVCTKPVKASL
jgi:hypothetical protein